MSKTLKSILIVTGTVCGLAITLSIIFYLVVLPIMRDNTKAEELKQENTQKIETQSMLDKCLLDANNSTNDYWNRLCESQKLDKGCSLPNEVSDRTKDYNKELKDECFKKYPVK